MSYDDPLGQSVGPANGTPTITNIAIQSRTEPRLREVWGSTSFDVAGVDGDDVQEREEIGEIGRSNDWGCQGGLIVRCDATRSLAIVVESSANRLYCCKRKGR